MITFETYNKIRFLSTRKQSACARIARQLNLCERTVQKWAARDHYQPRKTRSIDCILDPFKAAIRHDLEFGGSSGTEILKRLRSSGYAGGYSILKAYLRGLKKPTKSSAKTLLLPSEWMHHLLQGKLGLDTVLSDCHCVPPENATELLARIRHGPLRSRNRGIAVLAHVKGISVREIARFLMLDHRMVSRYIREYDLHGLDGLATYHRSRTLKHEQESVKTAVFSVLHSPPQSHGLNRTSWRMPDLKQVLQRQGVMICKDTIRRIIKDAGFRFRSAKRSLTSTDPLYHQKLAEVTRILSSLTADQKFFSIDEFGPFAIKIQGGRALAAPDEQRIVPQRQKSKGQLTVVGALELSTNQITHFYAERKSTVEMIHLMHLLLLQYQDQSVLYLSWDAASWHVSKAFLAEVERVNTSEYRKQKKTPAIALAPLPACAQFLNVIESIYSGMAKAIIHNSDYETAEDCKNAIDRYFMDRNESFREHPRRAGNKIWGKERVLAVFNPSNNCKDPMWR